MKRRIIGMLLVAVMVISALVGCGYNYRSENYSEYVEFDKAKLDAFLAEIEINDGDFTADEETRAKRVLDSIYESLAKAVDSDEKNTEGQLGAHDIIYYCYYATVTADNGQPAIVFASKMQQSSAVKFQLGLSDTTGINAEIEKLLAEYDLTGKAYSTKTEGTAESGKTAYISYTVTYKVTEGETEKTEEKTYEYERVVLGDESHDVAKILVGSTIGSAYKGSDNKTTFTVGEGENQKTYANAKVNWVVESGEELTFTHTTYETATSEKGEEKNTKYELKDKELTYHVFPVYYLSVEDFSAAEVLKTLISSLSVDSLPSFEGKEDAIKTINDLKTALAEAISKTAEEEEEVTTAEETLEKAKAAVTEGEEPTDAQKKTIEAAENSLAEAKEALKAAEEAEAKAESDLDAGITEFYNTVSAETIEKEYKENVYDGLLEGYNTEIKNNLAKAIWEKMKSLAKVTFTEKANSAIKPVYDRLMENHRYNFSTGTYNTTTKETNYHYFKGDFNAYLLYKTNSGDSPIIVAKDKVWAEAEAYVSDIFAVFAVAEKYGQKITDEDIKAFREDGNSSYEYYEFYYGEANIEAAVQFDKFMNYILEWETSEDEVVYSEGKIKFQRVGYKLAD